MQGRNTFFCPCMKNHSCRDKYFFQLVKILQSVHMNQRASEWLTKTHEFGTILDCLPICLYTQAHTPRTCLLTQSSPHERLTCGIHTCLYFSPSCRPWGCERRFRIHHPYGTSSQAQWMLKWQSTWSGQRCSLAVGCMGTCIATKKGD